MFTCLFGPEYSLSFQGKLQLRDILKYLIFYSFGAHFLFILFLVLYLFLVFFCILFYFSFLLLFPFLLFSFYLFI